jgi:hypothetical protein
MHLFLSSWKLLSKGLLMSDLQRLVVETAYRRYLRLVLRSGERRFSLA